MRLRAWCWGCFKRGCQAGYACLHVVFCATTTLLLQRCAWCRWGDDESDSDDGGADKLTAQQKQQAVNGFLKAALTDTLLSVTDSLLRDAATYDPATADRCLSLRACSSASTFAVSPDKIQCSARFLIS